MAQTVELNAYGMELTGADVGANTVEFDELLSVMTPDTSADGETALTVDGRDVLYGAQVIGRIQTVRSGTAPDTSLCLGAERKAWLAAHGGIQPTILRLIDEAMRV